MGAHTVTIRLANDKATDRLGATLAARLGPGRLVLLEGGLGAGKTQLARAIIRTLAGDPRLEVPSPSFALVQPYELASLLILHADLYRLGAAWEAEELGLFDAPEALVIVEWPERAAEALEPPDLHVRLDIAGSGRVATLCSPTGTVGLVGLEAPPA